MTNDWVETIPIIKNIIVTDASGRPLVNTYPKRANQLVNGALIQQDFESGFMTYDTENGEVSIYQKTKR